MHIIFGALANSYIKIYSLIEEGIKEEQTKIIEKDFDERTRGEVAIALSEFSSLPDARIPILLDALKNKSSNVRDRNSILDQLIRQPELSAAIRLALLEVALKDDSIYFKARVAIVLSLHSIQLPNASIQILLGTLKNTILDPGHRANAARALGQQLIQSKSIRSALEAALQDKHESVRTQAVIALNALNMLLDADIPILLDILKNKKEHRDKAAKALGQRPTLLKASRLTLEVALRDDNEGVRFEAALALAKHNMLPDADISILLDAVQNKNGSVVRKVSVVRILGKQPRLSEGIRLVLEVALQDSSEEVRLEAALSFDKHNKLSNAGVQNLLGVLKNKSCSNEARRAHAARVLSEQPALSEDIRLALQDKDEEVRVQAAIALMLPNADIPFLLDALQNKSYIASHRASAAYILGNQPTQSEAIRSALEAALQDGNEGVKIQAALALGKHSNLPNTGIPILLAVLKNKSSSAVDRANAAQALGKQATLSADICLMLEARLQDDDEGVKFQAALTLGKHSNLPKAGIPILLDMLKNKSGSAVDRANAAQVLGKQATLSADICLTLEARLEDDDEEVKIQAALTLGKHSNLPNAGIPILLDVLKNKSGSAVDRANAAQALGKQATLSAGICLTLEARLEDDDEEVKFQAALTLGKHSNLPKAGIPILLDMLKNKSGSAVDRANAAQVLGKQATLSADICLTLEARLEDDDEEVKIQAALTLGKHSNLPNAGIPILLDVLKNKSGSAVDRANAAQALGKQATLSAGICLTLEARLEDDDEEVKFQAALALGKHSKLPDAGIKIWLDALQNKSLSSLHRANAAWVLGEQTLSKAIHSALEAALQDSYKVVRFRAALVLSRHNRLSGDVMPILLDGLQDKSLSAVHKANAAWILGEQPTLSKAGRLALEAALEDDDEGVRLQAALALGKYRMLPGRGIQILLNAVKNKSLSVAHRTHAAWTLGEQLTLPKAACLALQIALQDDDESVKFQADIALGRHNMLPDAGGISFFWYGLNTKSFSVVRKVGAVRVLDEQPTLSKAGRSALEAALQYKDEEIRFEAALALGRRNMLSDIRGIRILLNAVKNKSSSNEARRYNAAQVLSEQLELSEDIRLGLQDKDEEVRVQAAIALDPNVWPNANIPMLLNALQNKDCSAAHRAYAAWTLGEQPTLSADICLALEAVLQDDDEGVRLQAAIALGRHSKLPDANIPILLNAVKNKNYTAVHRAQAAWTLGEQLTLLNAGCLALEAALQDDDEGVKFQAAIALGKHSKLPDADMPILLDALQNKNSNGFCRANAAQALGKQSILSEGIHLALKKAVQDSDKRVQLEAVIALGRHNLLLDAEISILLDAVQNKHFSVVYRVSAVRVLGEQSTLSEAGRSVLKLALQDNDEDVRFEAALVLSRHNILPDAGGIPILLYELKNKRGSAVRRANAAQALGKQATLSGGTHLALEAALQDGDEGVQLQAAIALGRHNTISGNVIPILLDALKNKSIIALHRAHAAWILGEQLTLSKTGCSALEAVLQDDDEEVRFQAAIALGKYRMLPGRGIQILLNMVKNKTGSVAHRAYAAWTLGEQPTLSKAGCLALQTALQDDDESVRVQADIALGRHNMLPDVDGISIFLDGIKHKNFRVVRKAGGVRVLGEQLTLSKTGGLALEAALRDRDEEVRLEAAIALGRHNMLPNAVIPILLNTLKNKNVSILRNSGAVKVLVEQPTLSKAIRSVLEAALKYSDEEARRQIAIALGR